MGRLSMDRNGMSWRMTVWNARAIAMKSAAELGRSHSSAASAAHSDVRRCRTPQLGRACRATEVRSGYQSRRRRPRRASP
eukprot:1196588-Rhodomonas_salina.1